MDTTIAPITLLDPAAIVYDAHHIRVWLDLDAPLAPLALRGFPYAPGQSIVRDVTETTFGHDGEMTDRRFAVVDLADAWQLTPDQIDWLHACPFLEVGVEPERGDCRWESR